MCTCSRHRTARDGGAAPSHCSIVMRNGYEGWAEYYECRTAWARFVNSSQPPSPVRGEGARPRRRHSGWPTGGRRRTAAKGLDRHDLGNVPTSCRPTARGKGGVAAQCRSLVRRRQQASGAAGARRGGRRGRGPHDETEKRGLFARAGKATELRAKQRVVIVAVD